jgi:hypothetical protein
MKGVTMELHEAVVVVTGARGTGKSTFASTYIHPRMVENVFYHDSERSANRIVQSLAKMDLEFGYYGDLQARFKDLPSDDDLLHRINNNNLPWLGKEEKSAMRRYYEYILGDLDENLTQGKYKVYILDTGEKFEAGMAAWVEDNITRFGYRTVREARRDGRIWTDCIYPLYEQLVSGVFSRGVEVIFLCFHLSTPWVNRKPVPGKVKPSGKPLLRRLSSFMLWLVNEPTNSDGAPAGLVLKERLGELTIVDDKWKPRRMIPARVPHCTWEDITNYLETGCDLANPAPGEVMSDSEREMISELLTDKQTELMLADARVEQLQKEIEAAQFRSLSDSVQTVDVGAMLGDKADPALVAQARELGLTAETKSYVRNQMIDSLPPPLRRPGPAVQKIDRAIEEVLSE